MNAYLGELLSKLVGSFVGDQSPQKNPMYGQQPGDVDPSFKGDPSDLVQQPYVTPSWGTRFFHPDVASQESSKNLEAFNALIENNARTGVGAANAQTIAPSIGQPFSNVVKSNPRAAGLLFPNPSAEGILSGNTASAEQAGGLPNMLADSALSLTPSRTNLELGRNAVEKEVIPSRGFRDYWSNTAEGLEGKRMATGSPKLDDILNTKLDTEINHGRVNKALSGEASDSIPLITSLQKLQRMNELWNVQHPEYPNALLLRDAATGNPYMNPNYVNRMTLMNAQLKGTGTGTTKVPLSSGFGLHLGQQESHTETAPLTVPVNTKPTSSSEKPSLTTVKPSSMDRFSKQSVNVPSGNMTEPFGGKFNYQPFKLSDEERKSYLEFIRKQGLDFLNQ